MAIRLLEAEDTDGGYKPLAEINVTPFVDVMLVLLIVFMVAAPLMTVGVKVALPKTSAARSLPPKEPLVLSIDAEGKVYLTKEPLAPDSVLPRLSQLHAQDGERVVIVQGDRSLTYGRIMAVMGQVSRAGFAKVSLIAEGQPAEPAR